MLDQKMSESEPEHTELPEPKKLEASSLLLGARSCRLGSTRLSRCIDPYLVYKMLNVCWYQENILSVWVQKCTECLSW